MACARTTNAVVYILHKKGHFVHCYIDNFVGVAPTKAKADEAYMDCMDITARLGLVLSPGKCIPSTKAIEWLGFNIDANAMQVTIPEEKLHDTLEECQTATHRRLASRKDLQKLVGRLNQHNASWRESS